MTVPPRARDPEAPRILIVRLSAMGDLVFATSLLDGLRRRWPGAWIAWLAHTSFAPLLQGDPRLNEVIALPRSALRSPAALWRLRRELKSRRFDWAIEAQGLAKSYLMTALASGATRIGFTSREPLQFLLDHAFPKGGDI
ncbi:MAG TPA: glycosyltransferase family 9 protein, partial [Verrucomicrobiae bacterium]|nr:glycosyltransferase family 9 protein [Verrucomicrobiae bacterium]